jgi:hypothetical protein
MRRHVLLALGLLAACEAGESNRTAPAGADRTQPSALARVPGAAAPGDRANAEGPGRAPRTPGDRSILAWSMPAAGAKVSAPVSELVLHFSPPARLSEVTVTGPRGAMPTRVAAVGEVEHYSLPLSELGVGAVTIDWKATASGVDYRGSFGFEIG